MLYCLVVTRLYIFWFLHQTTTVSLAETLRCGCISFDSYIKPQRIRGFQLRLQVVYLLIPTSNHNELARLKLSYTLYIFWFLHQTTTVFFIEQFKAQLYIFWFLHQTTTAKIFSNINFSCISFDSYIKPQLQRSLSSLLLVVYLLIPTSNHNRGTLNRKVFRLYIFWFLHQTTTYASRGRKEYRCISFDSYIKPQPIDLKVLISSVYQSLFLIRNGE